jgi:hypothetical protein
MLRVRPGVLLVRASFAPTSALIRLDFPTLERPRKAISGTVGAGKCVKSLAESMNRARIRIETVSSVGAANGKRRRGIVRKKAHANPNRPEGQTGSLLRRWCLADTSPQLRENAFPNRIAQNARESSPGGANELSPGASALGKVGRMIQVPEGRPSSPAHSQAPLRIKSPIPIRNYHLHQPEVFLLCLSGRNRLRLPGIIGHQKLPLNLLLIWPVLVMMILYRERLVASLYHFMPTDNAAVYSRPHDPVARAEEFIELIVRARGKVGQVPVFSHSRLSFRGTTRIVSKRR